MTKEVDAVKMNPRSRSSLLLFLFYIGQVESNARFALRDVQQLLPCNWSDRTARKTIRKNSLALVTPPNQLQIKRTAKQTIIHLRQPTYIFTASKDQDIKSIYEQVQQDDSDWYNALSKLLADDFVADRRFDSETGACRDTTNAGDVNSFSIHCDGLGTMSDARDNFESMDTSIVPTQSSDESIFDIAKNDDAESDLKQALGEKTLSKSKDTRAQKQKDDQLDKLENKTERLTNTALDVASQTVQLRNKYNRRSEMIESLSYFTKRGYSQEDILKVRPQVLELIVEDDIPKPRRGIPDKWIRGSYDSSDDSDNDWDVEIVDITSGIDPNFFQDESRSQLGIEPKAQSDEKIPAENEDKVANVIQIDVRESEHNNTPRDGAENSDSARTYRTERSPIQELRTDDIDDGSQRHRDRQTPYKSRASYYDDEEERPRSRNSRRQTTKPRRSSPRRRRELVLEREQDEDNDPPPNKFWMDLPTFRDFLRTEARLRLKILGPDWKESVLDESRWRFDLYKRWLYLLNDGVGENPLYMDRDRLSRSRIPRSLRKKRGYDLPTRERTPKRRRRAVVPRRRDVYGENDNDEEIMRVREQRYKLDNDHDEPTKASAMRDSNVASMKLEDHESLSDDDELEVKSMSKSIKELDNKNNCQRESSSNETELESRQRRRLHRSSTSPLSSEKTQEWKDFGDLEDQLLNGNIEYNHRNSQNTPRRRRRASREFDEY